MYSRGTAFASRCVDFVIRMTPVGTFYISAFNRKMIYRAAKFYAVVYLFSLFRAPYVKSQMLGETKAEKQLQEEQITSLLTKIDIKLSDYPENYFIIIAANFNAENDEQLLDKQKVLFEINALINKKLEVNQQYFQDVKFLFLGDEEIYSIIAVNNTLVEFYDKEKEKKTSAQIYIMNRESDGQEKLLTTAAFRPDLKSILNIISKHKARKFAESMQFS